MKTKYLFVVLFSIFASPCQMKEGYPIKLIRSTLKYAGQVQIKLDGSQWSSICEVGWDKKDAQVVCRQLGYHEAEAAILGEAFGHAPGQVVEKKFQCDGNERSLSDCPLTSHDSKEMKFCRKRVAAVLCKPNDLPLVFIMITLGVLALTSTIILTVTCKTMCIRKKRCPTTDSEIVLSNRNIEGDIEAGSTTEVERGSNEIGNAISKNSFREVEENVPCPVEAVEIDDDKKATKLPISDAELIESLSSTEVHNRNNGEKVAKDKESRKGGYMPLLKGSKALFDFYEKLLKRNRNRQSATEVDYAQDYYSCDQYSKDWQDANIPDIARDKDSSSTEEYFEVYPEEDPQKIDNGGDGYVPMLSLSVMPSHERAVKDEMAQDEYLDILPPMELHKDKNSPGSSKRESDYLDPVETNLPTFPEKYDGMASCSYDEELPKPPRDLLTLTNNDQSDKGNGSHLNALGLSNKGCRCEKDLMCKNCLDTHSIEIHKELDQNPMSRVNVSTREDDSDQNFQYMPMDHFSIEKHGSEVEEKVRRNSANYAIPMKKPTKDKRYQGSFPVELNQKIMDKTLSRPCDKRLMKSKKDVYDATVKREGREDAMQEKGYKGLTNPQNEQKSLGNEQMPKENGGHLEKGKPNLCTIPSFSKSKNYFENKNAGLLKETKTEAFSQKMFNPEESKSAFESPKSNNIEKARSESCPVEGTSVKASTSFLEALEKALKASGSKDGSEENSEQKQEDIKEHDYELDYEDIPSPSETEYENNDIYYESRPRSDEYDYVQEKQRKSLHFYEAVTKHLDEFEEDQYERI